MSLKTGQTIAPIFTTHSSTDDALVDADTLPAGVLHVNGVVDAAAVTVTNISTGRYKASVALPALSAGDVVSLFIAATMGGVVTGGKIFEVVADTIRNSDLSIPTAGAIADAVLDEDNADHLTAGSVGKAIDNAGSAANPLDALVPGSHASGTAGHALGRIGSGQIQTAGGVTTEGAIEEIVGGADYSAALGNAFEWTDLDGTAWPDLTGATVTWRGRGSGHTETTSLSMTVPTPTGTKKIRLEVDAATSESLEDKGAGQWNFEIWAKWTSPDRAARLVKDTANIETGDEPA